MVNGDGMTADRPKLFSSLWLFALLNYLYCDILTVMDPDVLQQLLTGSVGNGPEMTPGFFLSAAVLMEIPIAMIVAARYLKPRANRFANMAAGLVMTIVQIASLFVGTPTAYYLFFSVIEVGTTAAIFWLALRWSDAAPAELGPPAVAG